AKLLLACRTTLGVGSIVWLPMTRHQRSRLLCWRLGWMPNGRAAAILPQLPRTPHLSRMHVILCLQAHAHVRLNTPSIVLDPISFVLYSFPKARPTNASKKQFWKNMWQQLTTLLADIDALCH
ncbi:hypothetical protein BDB00DRAFT_742094, partial [Zychaea mexicana]|uniref:uncharacterized protein n=1 Tax=Zychaea mexicana TaxID=64656 RepID=UPI0022FEEC18